MNRSDEFLTDDLLAFAPQNKSQLIYPKRTPECPSLARFARVVQEGWSAQERNHVSGCPYCQYRMAKQWLTTPPTALTIAAYRAGQSLDKDGMEIYLSWPEAEGARRLLRKSLYVRALSEVFHQAQATQAGVQGILKDLISALRQMSVNTTADAFSRGTSSVGSTPGIEDLASYSLVRPFSLDENSILEPIRISTKDDSVTVEVQVFTTDSLRVVAFSPGIENAARRVFVELLPVDGEPVQVVLRLRGNSESDRAEVQEIVTVADAQRTLLNGSVLVAWVSK